MAEQLSPREAHLRLIEIERRRDVEKPRRVTLFEQQAAARPVIPPQKKLKKRRTTILTTRDALRLEESLADGEQACSWIRDAVIERLDRDTHGDDVLSEYTRRVNSAVATSNVLREALRAACAAIAEFNPTDARLDVFRCLL
jgi:hypothetical protein